MTLGIIGYGRFGKFCAGKLVRHGQVLVHDPRVRRPRAVSGITFASLAEAAAADMVILAVPVSSLRSVLASLRPHLRPGTLVLDVCAVKEQPVRWMRELLPGSVEILGTHPLFGPDSAGRSVRGKIIAVCPVRVRAERLRQLTRLAERAGLRPVFLTPRLHDRLMAETIFLTQLLGRSVNRAGLRRWPAVTSNYRHLLSIVETVRRDTDLLFHDMLRYSPESKRVYGAVRRAITGLPSARGRARR